MEQKTLSQLLSELPKNHWMHKAVEKDILPDYENGPITSVKTGNVNYQTGDVQQSTENIKSLLAGVDWEWQYNDLLMKLHQWGSSMAGEEKQDFLRFFNLI